MSFGHPSFVATVLLDEESADLDGEVPSSSYVDHVRSETVVFGSTTGPWSGIGGSAMSTFTMTELTCYGASGGGATLYFADMAFLGWVGHTNPEHTQIASTFPRLDDRTPGLDTDPATCPVPLPHRAARG